MYRAKKYELADKARESAKSGCSYRNFLVGCAVLAYHSQKRICQTFPGANWYPVKNGTKVCAEPTAIETARAEGFDLIVALVVAGKAQEDGESGILSPTLHPCGNCRRLLKSLIEKGIIQEDTIVYTIGLNPEDPTEEHTVEEILALHSKARQ